jgi:threonine/homoserine/homoserine lactone efflux protein
MHEFFLYLSALVIVFVLPGPDMFLLLRAGAASGRRFALFTVVGLALARTTHIILTAFGLAALFKTVPWTFETVRACGSAYLLWIAFKIIRAPTLAPDTSDDPDDERRRAGTYLSAVRQGLLTNLLNPKALLFCSVLLPQFIHPDRGAVAAQFLMLGSVLVLVGITFDTIYALSGNALGAWLPRHPKVEATQRWGFATVLAGFGLRLAMSST